MRKAALGVFALTVVFAVGCGGDTHEAVVKDSVKLMNDFAETVGSIKDKDSAEKAKTKLSELAKKMGELADRMKKVGDLPADKNKALQDKYEPEMKKAQEKIEDAMKALVAKPELLAIIAPVMKDLEEAGEKMDKALKGK